MAGRRKHAARRYVAGELVSPLTCPLPEDGKVVVLTDHVRQFVSAAGDSPHLLRGGSDDLARVPQVLDALAQLLEVLAAGLLPRGAKVAPTAFVGAPQSWRETVEPFSLERPTGTRAQAARNRFWNALLWPTIVVRALFPFPWWW